MHLIIEILLQHATIPNTGHRTFASHIIENCRTTVFIRLKNGAADRRKKKFKILIYFMTNAQPTLPKSKLQSAAPYLKVSRER